MNGKDNIINKILSDADEKCREILSDAESRAKQIADNAAVQAEKDGQAVLRRAESVSAERLKNRLATAELDARKYKLGQKQQLISDCYDRARQALRSLSASDRTVFLKNLIRKHADKGEVVYITKGDQDVVTQKFLDGFGKGLTLGKKFIDADFGIVLEGNGYEKDLTLSRIVEYLREQTEGKVASVLFGE
ncbi:MAG: V-type ATP synthase subunit E family protein [Corallococcus sp.]|nr:V-type ATP synthase subunit E family protein [Bacillota bacterium]MCM1534093.1 V-type ATP synthase subunit E family protein [Corallococcus sp.]